MQTIYRMTPASNFTIFSNNLISSSLPPVAKAILLYLLSKPKDWQPKPHDIQKQLGLSAYAVKKALRCLCSAGYAAWERLKSGHTIWKIFSDPVNTNTKETGCIPVIPPQVEIPQVVFQPVLQIIETEQIQKPLPDRPAPPIQPSVQTADVVVNSDELIYPVQLTQPQRKAAKHIIKKLKEPAIAQEVLFALSYAITSGVVKSAPAYLQGLVKRANDGTFEPVNTAVSNKSKPIIPIWTGFGTSTPSKPEMVHNAIAGLRAAIKGSTG